MCVYIRTYSFYIYIKKVGQNIVFRAKNLQPPLRNAIRYAYDYDPSNIKWEHHKNEYMHP